LAARSSTRQAINVAMLRSGVAAGLVALLVTAAAFVYRFNALGGALGGFDNDHFAQLARAIEVGRGALPLRDFADVELRALWPPLTYMASAEAQRVWGASLRSEAWLTVGLLALSAGLTCWLAARVSRSIAAAILATFCAVALEPKLYNYPKVLVASLAIAALAWFVAAPRTPALASLALVTVVAVLFRHDLGVHVAAAVGVTAIFTLGWRRAFERRLLPRFAVLVVLGLLPGLIFVQRHYGVVEYLNDALGLTVAEARRTASAPAVPEFDWTAPLVEWAPLPSPRVPRVNIRWAAGVGEAERRQREMRHRLESPEPRDERTWSYELIESSPAAIEAIVKDPLVDDTHGIDRATFVVTDGPREPWTVALQRRYPVLKMRPLPGVLRRANAAPWLYVVSWGVPIVCLILALARRQSPQGPGAGSESASRTRLVVLAVAVFALTQDAAMLRNTLEARLADVAVPVAVLGAWLLAFSARQLRAGWWPVRIAGTAVVAAAVGATLASVMAIGSVVSAAGLIGLTAGREGIEARWRRVSRELSSLPDAAATAEPDAGPFSRTIAYLRACTAPHDRILVGDFAPEVYYFTERGFAGGQVAFFSNFYSTPREQQATIARLTSESVPIALLQPASRYEEEFGADYPLVAAYIRERYRPAGRLELEPGRPLDVHVEIARPVHRTYGPLGLPCFR
jgi:hypothetical protein